MTRRNFAILLLGFVAVRSIPVFGQQAKQKRARQNRATANDRLRLLQRLEQTPIAHDPVEKETPENKRKRLAIIAALEPFGDQKIEVLAEIIKTSRSNPVRLGAAFALGELRDPKAIPILMDFACEGPEESAGADIEAGVALSKISDRAVMKAILDEIENGSRPRLNGACNAMAWLKQREFVPDILPLIDDKRPVVQIRAIEALGSIGDPAALPALKKMFKASSTDFATRYKLRNAIGQIESAEREQSRKKS